MRGGGSYVMGAGFTSGMMMTSLGGESDDGRTPTTESVFNATELCTYRWSHDQCHIDFYHNKKTNV